MCNVKIEFTNIHFITNEKQSNPYSIIIKVYIYNCELYI